MLLMLGYRHRLLTKTPSFVRESRSRSGRTSRPLSSRSNLTQNTLGRLALLRCAAQKTPATSGEERRFGKIELSTASLAVHVYKVCET